MPEPVLLIPGLLCDQFVFAAQQAALSGRFAPQIPVCRAQDRISAMADFVLEGAPGRFALLGFSMGGRVALEIMRRAPQRVTRLALLDTGAHAAPPDEAARRQPVLDLAAQQGMAALAASWLPPMLHPAHRDDAALVAGLAAMVCRFTPDEHARQIAALVHRPDAQPVLAGITCPTLVCCGRQDVWSNVAQHAAMAAAIPGATLRVVEESGHFTPNEAPAALNALLLAWLAGELEQEGATT